jgi:hypothetical protein
MANLQLTFAAKFKIIYLLQLTYYICNYIIDVL